MLLLLRGGRRRKEEEGGGGRRWEEVGGEIETESYLSVIAFDAGDFAPFFNGLRQIDHAKRQFHLSDLIVLGEAVKVVDGEDERLAHGIRIGHLSDNTGK